MSCWKDFTRHWMDDMASKKKKRSPVKKKAKGSPRSHKKTAKTKVRVDLHAEYAETMKKAGVANVSRLSHDECVTNIRGRISTGSLSLDALLVNEGEPLIWRGWPMGRTIELYGPPHSGKSTMLDQAFGSVQKMGGVAILADTENSRDRHYVGRLGVDMDALKYLEWEADSNTIESVLKAVCETAIFWKSKAPEMPVLIGWDALAGTATADEMEKGIASEKSHQPGAAAKAMATAARIVTPLLAGTKISFVVINHEYDNINSGPFAGPKRTTYGGHATRHMASLRVQLYNGKFRIKRSDGWMLGREMVFKVVKNRLGEHAREAIVPIVIGVGSENFYTLYKMLKSAGIITAAGSWSAINIDGDVISFQGWEGLKARCAEHEGLYEKLTAVFWQVYGRKEADDAGV